MSAPAQPSIDELEQRLGNAYAWISQHENGPPGEIKAFWFWYSQAKLTPREVAAVPSNSDEVKKAYAEFYRACRLMEAIEAQLNAAQRRNGGTG